MNCQKSLTNFSKFLFLFVSALALFQTFLYAEDVFLFLFPKRSGFYFLFFTDISDCKLVHRDL